MLKYDPYDWKVQYSKINQHSTDKFCFKTQAQIINNNDEKKITVSVITSQ